jgi:hypothetical protein
MLHEQQLEGGRGGPPEGRPQIGARERHGAPPRFADRPPPRYANRIPPHYRDRDARRPPYPPVRVGAYPQQRMPRTRLTEREPLPPPGARPRMRGAVYHQPPRPPGPPAYRGPPPGPEAGRPPVSREQALEQLRRQYNLGAPNGPPPMFRGPSSDPNQPFGPPPAPQDRSENGQGGRAGT